MVIKRQKGKNSGEDYSINTRLTHFMPLISLDNPRIHQKTTGFLMFPGGIQRDQWHEMSSRNRFVGEKEEAYRNK